MKISVQFKYAGEAPRVHTMNVHSIPREGEWISVRDDPIAFYWEVEQVIHPATKDTVLVSIPVVIVGLP